MLDSSSLSPLRVYCKDLIPVSLISSKVDNARFTSYNVP